MSRFYEIGFARESWGELMAEMQQRGINFPWGPDEAEAAASGEATEGEGGGDEEFGRSDAEITTRVDVSAHVDRKRRSMECHRTQRQDMGWILELPADLGSRVLDTESYVLRWRDGRDVPASDRETWLLS